MTGDAVGDEAAALSGASGTLTIDLAALVANWRALKERVAPARCAAVVKSDAYGCGIAEVGVALARAGCDTFFVAVPSEGLTLRHACPDAAIYILNGLATGQGAFYRARRLRPVLGSLDEIEEWQALGDATGAVVPAAIHVDTGMNRLGLSPRIFSALMGERGAAGLGFPVSLLMSHFVMSDDAKNPLNARQTETFRAMRALCPDVPGSLANSSGVFLGGGAHHDLARPGYALYGGNPTPGGDNPMHGVITLTVPVAQLRVVEAGASIGYDAQWTAPTRCRIATISAGYADGYPRGASATDAKLAGNVPAGEAIVAGRRCPFVGRVSMDLITVDVTDLPEDAVKRGNPVTLIGEGLPIDEVGRRAGTIGYEILTRLGRRFERRYLR